ncbi:MAG: hypothetical protein ABI315_01970 [Bacteroidia bacterium]
MEYIGKRVSIKHKDEEISIIILSATEKKKIVLLFTWLFLWSIGGIIVFVQLFIIKEEETKVALAVWLAFWAYFEYKIIIAFLWRKFGIEKIKLRSDSFLYKRSIAGKGEIKNFQFDFIKDFRIITLNENSFIENINNSYWVIAGERLAFDYNGKEIKFGIQLPEKDADQLFKLIRKLIIN